MLCTLQAHIKVLYLVISNHCCYFLRYRYLVPLNTVPAASWILQYSNGRGRVVQGKGINMGWLGRDVWI